MVVEGKEIARDGVVAADVAAGAGDLRGAVGGSGAGDDDGADGTAGDEAGDIDGGAAEKVERGAGEAEACGVEQLRREDVLLLDAGDLLAQRLIDGGEGVGGGGVRDGVVDGVDAEEEVLRAEVVIGARGAEVFADGLLGTAERTSDAGGLAGGVGELRAIGRGPELAAGRQRRGRRRH